MIAGTDAGRGARGIALVEILVSVALFTVGVVTVMSAMRTSWGALGASEDLHRLTLRLDEIVAGLPRLPDGGAAGTSDGIAWAVHEDVVPLSGVGVVVPPTPEEEATDGTERSLRRFTVRVSRDGTRAGRELEAVRLLSVGPPVPTLPDTTAGTTEAPR